MKKKKIFKTLIMLFILVCVVTGCGKNKEKSKENKEQEKEIKYQFVVSAYDVAETTTTYDITVKKDTIVIKYKNEVAHPELADGPLDAPNGGFTIEDKYFVEPLKKVLETWKKETGENGMIDDNASLLISSLEKSQDRNANLCEVYASWYCDIFEDLMDYNNDGKITVEENFAYYVHEIDPSIKLMEDNRDNTIGKDEDEWDKKGLIPEKQSSTAAKRYKTSEVVNEIVLNNTTYKLGVDTVQKLLDNGFEFNREPDKELTTSRQLFGSFKAYPDASITIVIEPPKYGEPTPIEDCIIMSVDVKLSPNTEKAFYWKIKDFVVNEHTKKSEINAYFDLSTNGSKSVYLYTEDFLVELQCGSIYETHEYSNYFRVKAIKYNDNMTIPTWAK